MLLRRRILISRLQYRLLVMNLLHFGAIVLVFASVVLFPLMLQLRRSTLEASPKNLEAANEFLFLHARLWPALFIVVALLALHSVIVSHRIAGPLYRFRHVLEAIGAGDLSARARLRRNDYLAQEADAINAMIEALGQRVAGVEAQSLRLREALLDLMRARESGSAEALEEATQTLAAGMDELKSSLGQFRMAVPLVEDGPKPPTVSAPALVRAPGSADMSSPGRPGVGESSERGPARHRGGRASGLTMIELVITMAVIATLAAIAVPLYADVTERARVIKAIADIRILEDDISVFENLNGRLPTTLDEIGRGSLLDSWGNPYQYLNFSTLGNSGKGQMRKDRFLVPLNSTYDLYSMGKDGQTTPPLTAKVSADDVVRANDGGFIGLASEY